MAAIAPVIRTIQDVFERVDRSIKGNSPGSVKLAAALGLHAYTVENWRRHGIPNKHWPTMIERFDLTPAELYMVSRKCKERLLKRAA